VVSQGFSELLGCCDDVQRELITRNNPIRRTILGLERTRMVNCGEPHVIHPCNEIGDLVGVES